MISFVDGTSARINKSKHQEQEEEERRLDDAVCGDGYRLRYAVECNDGSVTLYPAPNNEKIDYCSNPNDSWLQAKCRPPKMGGLKKLLTMFSGCYPESPKFWADFMDIVIEEGESVGPIPLDGISSSSSTTTYQPPPNMGFEEGNLNEWTMINEEGYGTVFCSDGDAAEGICYAYISPGLTTKKGDTTGILERQFPLPELPAVDSGCALQVPSEGSEYCFSFFYRFLGGAAHGKRIENNDSMTVQVGTSGALETILDSDYIDLEEVGRDGDSGWRQMMVTIPPAPAGIPYNIKFTGLVENEGRDPSDMLLDGFSISVGACPLHI